MNQANKLPALIPQDLILRIAGQECFQLGLTLSQNTALSNLHITQNKASADIDGQHVDINFNEKQIQGACSCPSSEGFDFCEHCVCLCLQVNKQNQQIRSLAKGPDKSKILAYLLNLEKQDLAKQLLNLITEDPIQYERYLLKAFLHQGEIDYSQLRGQITNLTRKPDNLFSQRQVKIFFGKLERFLAELSAEDAPSFDLEKLQKVLEYTFQRINSLLEHIDDSTEQRQGCLHHLHKLYASLLKQSHCRDDTQAKRFFNFWFSDRFDLLGLNSEKWLNTGAQVKFKRLAQDAWKEDTSNSQSTMQAWQKMKLARYLFEEAIQSHDNLRANEYRRFFSKD